MKKYIIYQCEYNNEYWELQNKNEIELQDYRYKMVYQGLCDSILDDDKYTSNEYNNDEILELIFEKFNVCHPIDYKGRSLSVGDIVQLEDKFYICCSIGWKEINRFENVFREIIGCYSYDDYGYKNKDEYYISYYYQYKKLQNFAFSLENRKVYISIEFADYLNEKYNDLMIKSENEKGIDLSGDYLMDFKRWVKGAKDVKIYW